MKRRIATVAAATMLAGVTLATVTTGGAEALTSVAVTPKTTTKVTKMTPEQRLATARNAFNRADLSLAMAKKNRKPAKAIASLTTARTEALSAYGSTIVSVGVTKVPLDKIAMCAITQWASDATAAAKRNPRNATAKRQAKSAQAILDQAKRIYGQPPTIRGPGNSKPKYDPSLAGRFVAPKLRLTSATCMLNSQTDEMSRYQLAFTAEISGGTFIDVDVPNGERATLYKGEKGTWSTINVIDGPASTSDVKMNWLTSFDHVLFAYGEKPTIATRKVYAGITLAFQTRLTMMCPATNKPAGTTITTKI